MTRQENLNSKYVPEDLGIPLSEFMMGVVNNPWNIDVREIILYGSRAEGRYKKESDVDLAVIISDQHTPNRYGILPEDFSYWEQLQGSNDAALSLVNTGTREITSPSWKGKFQVVVCIPSDFNEALPLANDGRGPLSDAIKRGIPLYQSLKRKPKQ